MLNQILKDRQMRDWEKRLREIEEYRKTGKRAEPSQAIREELKTTNPEQ
jgi:hypothetical protein